MTEPLIRCVACGTTRQQDDPPCTCLLRTPQPWHPGDVPTPVQLLAWVRVATDDEVLALLDGLLGSSQVAHRCLVMDHDHGMRELSSASLDRARWQVIRDHVEQTRPDDTTARKVRELMGEDHTP